MAYNANTQTASTKQQIIYSDIANNFDKAPFSDDLARVTNVNSVKQSIRNIIRTKLGERLYDDTIGSVSQYGLFELADFPSGQIMIQYVKNALAHNEPRAIVQDVVVDMQPDNYYYTLTVYFSVINVPGNFSVSVNLKRIR